VLITKTEQLSAGVKRLYTVCTNFNCGAGMVFTLAHSHDVNPPQQTTLQIAAALIKTLPDAEKKALQRDVFG
jgi:cell division protein ZapA